MGRRRFALPSTDCPEARRPHLRGFALRRHVARVRRVYSLRREILASCRRWAFGDGIGFTLVPGGMALWVCLRMSVDADAWARRSLQRGVSWYTGRRYAFDGQSKPFARFSFAWLNERDLPEAVKRMVAARPLAPIKR